MGSWSGLCHGSGEALWACIGPPPFLDETPTFITALLATTAREWKPLSVPRWRNEFKTRGVCIQGNVIQPSKKEGKPAVGDNIDEPGGPYVKLNVPDTEGRMTALIRARRLKPSTSQKRRGEGGGRALGGGGNGELPFSRCGVSATQGGWFWSFALPHGACH